MDRLLAYAITAFIVGAWYLFVGFTGAMLWEHWHPVAGIVWILMWLKSGSEGADALVHRWRRRSARDLDKATAEPRRAAEKMQGGAARR